LLLYLFFTTIDPDFTPNLSDYHGMEILDAIKYYIQISVEKFFPKRTRDKLVSYAEDTSFRTPVQVFNTIREYFNKIEYENQSRVIFIFDHILE
jgi:hypothetical protein